MHDRDSHSRREIQLRRRCPDGHRFPCRGFRLSLVTSVTRSRTRNTLRRGDDRGSDRPEVDRSEVDCASSRMVNGRCRRLLLSSLLFCVPSQRATATFRTDILARLSRRYDRHDRAKKRYRKKKTRETKPLVRASISLDVDSLRSANELNLGSLLADRSRHRLFPHSFSHWSFPFPPRFERVPYGNSYTPWLEHSILQDTLVDD